MQPAPEEAWTSSRKELRKGLLSFPEQLPALTGLSSPAARSLTQLLVDSALQQSEVAVLRNRHSREGQTPEADGLRVHESRAADRGGVATRAHFFLEQRSRH